MAGHKDGGKLILGTYSHVNRVHSNRMAQLMIDEPEQTGVAVAATRCGGSGVDYFPHFT